MFERLKKLLGIRDEESVSKDIIRNRWKGEVLPLSIATAMIVEGEYADPAKWSAVMTINMRTLLRNILDAIPSQDRFKVRTEDIIEVLLDEMQLLIEIIPQYNVKTQVDFYLPDYSRIPYHFPHANLRTPNTEKQKHESHQYGQLLRKLNELVNEDKIALPFHQCDWKLYKDPREVTMLTSFPTDLLAMYNFKQLTLLESHTGRLKSRRQWGSKLNHVGDENLSNLPLNPFTIQVFGDRVFFNVIGVKLKRHVKRMALDGKWHPLTTEARIRDHIYKDKSLDTKERSILRSLLS